MRNRVRLPSPIKIDVVDLDRPLPDLRSAGSPYTRGWIIGRQAGVPIGITEVDLQASAPSMSDQLQVESMSLATKIRDRVGVPDHELPMISVVLPTLVSRVEELRLCLDSLESLNYPSFEVILVDNRRASSSPDPLVDLVRDRAEVRVVRQRRPGISAARNAGLAAATGHVVAFTDDDVRVDPGWLRGFGERFARSDSLQGVAGIILPAELETPAQIWFENYYGGFGGKRTFSPMVLRVDGRAWERPSVGSQVVVRDNHGQEVGNFPIYGVGAYGAGANMAFRRGALEALGGFDLALGTGTAARGGEDLAALIGVLWNGGDLGYEPASVVYHQHRRGYKELLAQLSGNGIGYTAMLTSLIAHDRTHLLGLAKQMPPAARRWTLSSLGRFRGRKIDALVDATRSPAYPRALVVHEALGMLRGPMAYIRSRRATRRWKARSEIGSGAAAFTDGSS